jgi:hypothetical protein
MPHSARLSRSAGLTAGGGGCGWACPREGAGAAQCVGQPVPAVNGGCIHPPPTQLVFPSQAAIVSQVKERSPI